jgi:Family of unknown function (DUF6221)
MTDLTAFLLARIDEDEARARVGPAQRSASTVGVAVLPEQVLADCDAKRRLVERFTAVRKLWLETRVNEVHIGQQHLEQARRGGEMDGLWRALTYMAQAYVQHPDYEAQWQPSER